MTEKYLEAFNDAHGTRHEIAPGLRASVRACLEAEPPYRPEALISAAIMSIFDDWYNGRSPALPLRYATDGKKSHLDDLLAIVPSINKPTKRLIELVKAHGVADYFNERTKRPSRWLKTEEGA